MPELDAAFEQWLRAPRRRACGRGRARPVGHRRASSPYIPLVTANDVWVHAPELVGYRPYKANLYPFYQPVRLAGR